MRALNDGNDKQRPLFSDTPEYDTRFQSAGVAESTVLEQHHIQHSACGSALIKPLTNAWILFKIYDFAIIYSTWRSALLH